MYDKMLTESTQGEDGLFDKETIDFGRTWNLDRIDRDNQYLYFDPYNTSAAFAGKFTIEVIVGILKHTII